MIYKNFPLLYLVWITNNYCLSYRLDSKDKIKFSCMLVARQGENIWIKFNMFLYLALLPPLYFWSKFIVCNVSLFWFRFFFFFPADGLTIKQSRLRVLKKIVSKHFCSHKIFIYKWDIVIQFFLLKKLAAKLRSLF